MPQQLKTFIVLATIYCMSYQVEYNKNGSTQNLKYQLLQYILPDFQGQGITNLVIDNNQDQTRGTIYTATRNKHIKIYYPNNLGIYEKKQEINIGKNNIEINSLEVYNHHQQNVLVIGLSNRNIIIYRCSISKKGQFTWTQQVQTNKQKAIKTYTYFNDQQEYIIVKQGHKSISLYHHNKYDKESFKQIQMLQLQQNQTIQACTFVQKLSITNNPILFVTLSNHIAIYQLKSGKFQKTSKQLILTEDDNTKYQNHFNIIRSNIYTDRLENQKQYDVFIVMTTQQIIKFYIKYLDGEFLLQFIHKIVLKDHDNNGIIQQVVSSQDGYIAALLTNHTIKIYGPSKTSSNQLQLVAQLLPQLKVNPKFQQITLRFSENHYQLLVNLYPQQLNIYTSNDSPIHQNMLLFQILFPTFLFIIIFIILGAIFYLYFRYSKQVKDMKSPEKTKPSSTEQDDINQSHQLYSYDQASKQDLYGATNMNIVHQKQQQTAYNMKMQDKSEVINWKQDCSSEQNYDQQNIQ